LPNHRVVLAANSAWNIVNYRAGLISALKQQGLHVVVAAPFDAGVKERLAELGVEQVAFPVDRSGSNPLADLHLLWRYRRMLGRSRPAAFLSFTAKPNIYGSLAARFAKVPAIANISGLGTAFARPGPLMSLLKGMYRVALAQTEVVFFQNQEDRQQFVEERIVREDQARLVPGSGVDLERFSTAPLPPGPPRFLLISRLLRDKGIAEFVQAAEILRDEIPGARLQLLGPIDDGNRTAIPRSQLDQWVARGLVEYLGEAEDVRPFIREASAIVLPSYYREGVPRSLLEGAAMARPIITTTVRGCRELVVGQEGGLACEPKDARSLADAMLRVAKLSPNERTAMGLASRRLAEARFDEKIVIRAYVDALAELGAVPGPRAHQRIG
jgi:glycosyltransferase involved in cell wall biosynthesis